ncbi:MULTISPECIES: adenosylcobinamide-phosphate synthase CbiB [Mesorhizobium]|uniref:Cobalamin biosynthesis protein CobD n=1 Tax=Mesorhizobium denitrificans TaxID=2294114 RepID=A0A371XFS4_9HYPH|nr:MULTISPECIES: adenosylcobinamide-phosphate synthase CbiB [Mesorhizobium]RFC68086.1 cobalamin biosynthesis protein CobD [Mesorhizobium denitrificans]
MLALLSLIFELGLGYPDRLFKSIGHPVTWIGALITRLDVALNRHEYSPREKKIAGSIAALIIVLVPAVIGLLLERVLGYGWIGLIICALIGSSLIAQRSLAKHVEAVADALESGGVEAGRIAVSQIVGRDPERLDEAAICRAAIESLAENFSDGVVAPAFWMALGGLAGGAGYKAANTADSMIGHKSDLYRDFGWASARFDDLINLPASRLTGLAIIAAAWALPETNWKAAWAALRRDAGKHRSPNAGWPEAAMAGALGIALAGPRVYGGVMVPDTYMGEGGRRDVTPADIRRALRLYWTADAMLIGLVALCAVLGLAN